MRIDFALSAGKFGGGMKILVELASHLALAGHDVSITLLGKAESLAWADLSNVKIIEAPFHNGVAHRILRKIYKKMQGAAAAENEYWYWDQVSALLGAFRECDIRVGTSPVSSLAVALDQKHTAGFNYLQHFEPLIFTAPFLNRLARISARLPLHTIANSTWLKETLVRECLVSPDSISVLPSAVNSDVFYPRTSDRFPRVKGKRRIVMMGKPHPWKGFGDALKAMEMVFARDSNIEWVVYAAQDELPRNENAPYTLMTGLEGDSLAELLSTADIVVVPSWYESSPLPVLEALACGAPLITTRLGTEDLVHDDETAVVIPPKDPAALAQAILRLVTDEPLRQRLRAAGLAAVTRFTWQNSVSNIERIFKDELAAHV